MKALRVVAVGIIASQTHWMLVVVQMVQQEGRQISLLFHL